MKRLDFLQSVGAEWWMIVDTKKVRTYCVTRVVRKLLVILMLPSLMGALVVSHLEKPVEFLHHQVLSMWFVCATIFLKYASRYYAIPHIGR